MSEELNQAKELIENNIQRINGALTKMGYPPLDDVEKGSIRIFGMRQAAEAISQQAASSPTLPPSMSSAIEGGFVNDRSGLATQRFRRQQGIAQPLSGQQ